MYIYQNKKLSLDLFGTLELEGAVPDPEILRKERAMPVEGLKFTFNPSAKTDEAFVQFYASEKGKILPLANSDIELQLHQAKQIVNIGNPFDIPGIGKIVKTNDGKLIIQPGYFTIPPVSGSGRPVVLKERLPVNALPKGERESKPVVVSQKQKQIILLSVIGIGLIALVWAFIKFVLPLLQSSPTSEQVSVVNADTTTVKVDSVPTAVTTIAPSTVVDSSTIKNWKAIIGNAYGAGPAKTRLDKLVSYGHNVKMETKDSNAFSLYIPIQASIRDTAQRRDSLAKFFAFPVKIEPGQ